MVTILICLLLILSIIISLYFIREHRIKKNALSFKDSMDLVELPVVTFYSGKKKLNMLLDTGSSESIISSEYLDDLIYVEQDYQKPLMGMEGNVIMNKVISTIIYYGGFHFEHTFIAPDMSSAFTKIKETTGVTIHGILGSDFFTQYKYVLDFDKLTFYKK